MRGTGAHLILAACAVLLQVASSTTARAQPAQTPSERAESLFHDGKAALEAGRYAEACPQLAESQKLDPATGTLMALGMCHQGEGRTATAWRELQQVIEASTKSGRNDRVQVARDLMHALEPRLSRVTVRADAEQAREGVQVRLDGAPLTPDQWNQPQLVDPGDHTVDATLAGAAPWQATVHIASDADSKTIDVPKLQAAAPPPSPIVPDTTTAPTRAPGPDRTLGWVVGGAGVAVLATGAVFGVMALSNHSDATTKCPSSPCSDQSAVQANDRAKTFAWVSDFGVGLGLVGVGVGAYLLLWPRRSHDAMSAQVFPAVGPGTAGITVSRAW